MTHIAPVYSKQLGARRKFAPESKFMVAGAGTLAHCESWADIHHLPIGRRGRRPSINPSIQYSINPSIHQSNIPSIHQSI